MDQLEVMIETVGAATILRASGKIDADSTSAFDEFVREALNARPKRLVVSLRGVPFLASAGWSVLLAANRELRLRGGALTIAGMNPQVQNAHGFLGLQKILRACATEQEALASPP